MNHQPINKKQRKKQRRRTLFLFRGKWSILFISGLLGWIIAYVDRDLSIYKSPKINQLAAKVQCQLRYVIDGDTIVAECVLQVLHIRLLGIDAPEMQQKPWGEKSKILLQQNLATVFTLQNIGEDIYHRVLGILKVNGQDINKKMIELGAAVVYDSEKTPIDYFIAEQQAKAHKLGIWSVPGLQQNPYRWRRYHK